MVTSPSGKRPRALETESEVETVSMSMSTSSSSTPPSNTHVEISSLESRSYDITDDVDDDYSLRLAPTGFRLTPQSTSPARTPSGMQRNTVAQHTYTIYRVIRVIKYH
jgi:hypothetical protein